MRWNSETWEQWKERCDQWHEWYAWHPVKDHTNGYRMWMEKVLRKLHPGHGRMWDYRPVTILESDLKSQATIDAEKSIPTPSGQPRRKRPQPHPAVPV